MSVAEGAGKESSGDWAAAEAWLAMALRVIGLDSEMSLADKKRFRWQALDISAKFAHDKSKFADRPASVQRDAIDELEDVLAGMSSLIGTQFHKVEQAKAWLREKHGQAGKQLAARLGNISKSRNQEAHPPVPRFLSDLRCLVEGVENAEEQKT